MAAATLYHQSKNAVKKIFEVLQEVEAKLGQQDCATLRLSGSLEGDGHCLAKCYVSVTNPHFTESVKAWQDKHKAEQLPKALLLHYRVASLCYFLSSDSVVMPV